MKSAFYKILAGLLMCLAATVYAAPVALSQADYIIAVNSVLRDPTWENTLVSLKEAQGLAVGILNVPDADFNNLSAAWSQRAIRDILSQAYFDGNKRLKYVLLVGDANALAGKMMAIKNPSVPDIASRNYASARFCNFVPGPSRVIGNVDYFNSVNPLNPVPPVGDPNRSCIIDERSNENGMMASDDFYGNFEGDMYVPFEYDNGLPAEYQSAIIPEAAVGRIPVRNITEMRNFVIKLNQYQNGLTTTAAAMTAFQKNILGAMDDRNGQYALPGVVTNPFYNLYNATIPVGITLTAVSANAGQVPNLFNKNGTKTLLTLYSSGTGSTNELDPFFMYRFKYPSADANMFHDRPGDDDIDDYPAITDGSYTTLVSTICSKVNFDCIDQKTISRIVPLANGSAYYDGVFHSGDDLESDILLTPDRGAIAYIGSRGGTITTENESFNNALLCSVWYGESVIGRVVRNAKQHCRVTHPLLRSRNEPGLIFGDAVLLGDPAMVLNTPNQGANLSNPATITIRNTAGTIVANWSAVSGASGYSVAIGTDPGIYCWTYTTTATTFSMKWSVPGFALVNGQTYYIKVRPYKTQGTIPCFARNDGISGSVVCDIDGGWSPYIGPATPLSTGGVSLEVYVYATIPDFKGYRYYRHTASGGTVLLTNPFTTSNSIIDPTPPIGELLTYSVRFLDNNDNEGSPAEFEPVRAIPQIGAGLSFVNSGIPMGLIDGNGNLYVKGNMPAVTGEPGLNFSVSSTPAVVRLSAATGNLQANGGVNPVEWSFLSVPGNLTGGLTITDGAGRVVTYFGQNGNGQVKMYLGTFENAGW